MLACHHVAHRLSNTHELVMWPGWHAGAFTSCCQVWPSACPSAAQLLGCATLFWFAMVLKTIISRAVSSHFMKEAHFNKMKIALEKVHAEPCATSSSMPLAHYCIDDSRHSCPSATLLSESLQAGCNLNLCPTPACVSYM